MVIASAQQGTRTTPVVGWGIEQPEYDARVARVRRELERRRLHSLVLFHPIRMAYLSGFFHYSTERPMAIVVGPDGGLAALVPHLEQDHIAAIPAIDRLKVMVYPEYPTGGAKHPPLYLVDLLSGIGGERQGNAAWLRLERVPRYQWL
jgi:Xaa-Pro dipeptidase